MAALSNIGAKTGPQHSPRLWCALGLMSGTPLDGLDVAMVETDGRSRVISAFDRRCAVIVQPRAVKNAAGRYRVLWRSVHQIRVIF